MNASSYRPVDKWCFPADRDHGEIVGVACDSKGRVFLFTRGTPPVMVFDRDANPLTSWGGGLFERPHGIFIGPDDTVYCTDDFDHSVRAFTPDGTLKMTLGTRGKPSDTGAQGLDYRTIRQAAGPFCYPTNLAIAPNGDFFVADGYGNARIHHFSAEGRLLKSWGEPGFGPGQFHIPHGIAVDKDGTVYVADRENSRIQLFSSAGVYLDQWTDVARPCQVYIGKDGLFYVAELGMRAGRWPGWPPLKPGEPGGRVGIFDKNGKLVTRWGGGDNPTAPGDFFAPHDIWVDSRGDIYVAEVTLSAGGRKGVVPTSCHTLQKFERSD